MVLSCGRLHTIDGRQNAMLPACQYPLHFSTEVVTGFGGACCLWTGCWSLPIATFCPRIEFCFDSCGNLFQIAGIATRVAPRAPLVLDRCVVNNWVVTMAKADLGIKRTCLSCGMRFYDFKRTPIICPGCQSEFDPESLVRSKRSRASTKDTASKVSEEAAADAAEDAVEEAGSSAEDGIDTAGGAKSEDSDDIGYDDDDIDVDDDDDAGLISNDLDDEDDILPGIGKDDDE